MHICLQKRCSARNNMHTHCLAARFAEISKDELPCLLEEKKTRKTQKSFINES